MTKLIGPFTRIRTLGAGGGAKVYAARDALGREVAVKVPHTHVGTEPIDREIAATALLDHPNIVRVLDYGHAQNLTWLSMEASNYGTLADHPPHDLAAVDAVVSRILEALAYAHARRVLHLDLKPSNILVVDLETMDVKIADFGQSSVSDEPGDPHETPTGTPQYMAPEQFSQSTHLYGPWTDIYAVGCMVFEWIFGRPPFVHGDFLQLGIQHAREPFPSDPQPLFDVPPALIGWVRRALAKAHGVRFQGAHEAFAAWRRAIPSPERPAPPAPIASISSKLAGLREPPFVGHADALRTLGDVLDQSLTRRDVRLVILSGPTGIGKSRVARHFAEREEAAGRAQWFRSQFMPGDLLDPIAVMLATALGVNGKSIVEAPRLIEERLGSHISLDAILGVVEPALLGSSPKPRLTPKFAHRVIMDAIQEIAGSHVPILILDDADLAINALDFCENALTTHGQSGLIIATVSETPDALVATRLERWRTSPTVKLTEITIGQLSPDDVDRMLHSWVRLDSERRADIVMSSKGTPLLAVMAVKHDVDVKHTDLEAVWARALAQVDRELPEVGRSALEVAAAMGVRVDQTLWADILSRLGYPPNTRTLEKLARIGVIRNKVGSFVFDHHTLRDAVLKEAQPAWLREIHRQTALALSERQAPPWNIGQHLEAAGEREAPISPWLAAAYSAAVFESPHVAQQMQKKAVDALQALKIDVDDPRWGLAILVQLHIDAQTEAFTTAHERAEDLIARAQANDWPDLLAEALEVDMRLLNAMGRYLEAIAAGEQARMVLRVEGNERPLARLTAEIAEVLHISGKSQEALAYLRDALVVYRRLDDVEGTACSLALAGDILAPEDPGTARECYDEALGLCRRMAMRDLEAHVLDGIAKVDYAQGKVTDAMLGFDRAEVTYGSIGATAVWVTRYNRAYVRLRAGQRDGLLEGLDQCAEAFAEIGMRRYLMFATAALLECAALDDDRFVVMSQLRVLEAELDPQDRCAEIELPLREAWTQLSKNHEGLARAVRELLAHIGVK